MYIKNKDWQAYINRLSALNEEAARKMREYVMRHGFADTQALIDYAYGIATKYGEGAAALAAEMYDTLAELESAFYEPAELAETASYDTVAQTVRGVTDVSQNIDYLSGAVARLVKQAGADTTLRNAARDDVEWAWVPSGDGCAFCRVLASRGWQRQSKRAAVSHAEHIHANCNCQYVVRFSSEGGPRGYDPDRYLAEYDSMPGGWRDKMNAMRRDDYEQNRDTIRAQQREAYRLRREQAES